MPRQLGAARQSILGQVESWPRARVVDVNKMAKRKSITAKFQFHGSFERKSAAMAQERKVPGAFIVPTREGRFAMVTAKGRKNPIAPVAALIGGLGTMAAIGLLDSRGARREEMQKLQRSTAKSAAKKRVAARPQKDLGAVVSALRGLGYKATEARSMAEAAQKRTQSSDFQTLLRSAMANARRRNTRKVAKKHPAKRAAKRNSARVPKATKREVKAFIRSAVKKSDKKKTRRNPRKPASLKSAQRVFKMFHGRKAERVSTRRVSTARKLPGNDFAKLGDLNYLKVKNPAIEGGMIRFGLNERPILATNPKKKGLFIIGGQQNLDIVPPVRRRNPGEGLDDLGELVQLEYFARKQFDGYRPANYYHDLGEENGKRPRLMYDRKNKQLHVVGGDYKIQAAGIRN